MRQQRIDEAGLRGEVAAQHRGAALVARDFVEQALELGEIGRASCRERVSSVV